MSLSSKAKAFQVATPFAKEMILRLEDGMHPLSLIGHLFNRSDATQDIYPDWVDLFDKQEQKDFDFPYFLVFIDELQEASNKDFFLNEHLILSLCLYLDKEFQNFDFYGQDFYQKAIKTLISHCSLSPTSSDFSSSHNNGVNALIPIFSHTENIKDGIFCLDRERETRKLFSHIIKKEVASVVITSEKGSGFTHFVKHLAYLMSMGLCPQELRFCDVRQLRLSYNFEHNESKISAVTHLVQNQQKVVIFIDNFDFQFYKNHASGKIDFSGALARILTIPNIRVIIGMEKNCYDKTLFNNPDYAAIHLPNLHHDTQSAILKRKIIEKQIGGADNKTLSSIISEQALDFFLKIFSKESLKHKIQKYDLLVSYLHTKKSLNTEEFVLAAQDCGGDAQKIKNLLTQLHNTERCLEKFVSLDDVKDFVNFFGFIQSNQSQSINSNELKKLIKNKIFGQDEAIEVVAELYDMANHCVVANNRPRGIILLAGPTGCGKTSLAENFAELTGHNLIRLNMTEYNDEISSNKLIGAAPGYVGYETDTPLASQLQKHPHSIILIDEIEKAHQSVCNTFLQIFDKGEFVTGDGKKIDVTKSYIFMTSNVGGEMISGRNLSMGFSNGDKVKLDLLSELKKVFKPEFINRIDRIQTLQKIGKDAAISILKKNFDIKNTTLNLKAKDSVFEHLREKYFNDDFGGRSLIRSLEQHIFLPAIKSGAKSVDIKDGNIIFKAGKKSKKNT